MNVQVGDTAPDFTLPSQSGEMVSLHDFLGKKNVILYFYPKDFTTGCTMEAHAFRDTYPALASTDTEVLGVSSDTIETHKRFSESCGLPFDILSDRDAKVRVLYGVTSKLGMISPRFTGRTTFLIDKTGVVRMVFTSELQPTKHVKQVTEALNSLSPPGNPDRPEQSPGPSKDR